MQERVCLTFTSKSQFILKVTWLKRLRKSLPNKGAQSPDSEDKPVTKHPPCWHLGPVLNLNKGARSSPGDSTPQHKWVELVKRWPQRHKTLTCGLDVGIGSEWWGWMAWTKLPKLLGSGTHAGGIPLKSTHAEWQPQSPPSSLQSSPAAEPLTMFMASHQQYRDGGRCHHLLFVLKQQRLGGVSR